MKDVRVEIRFKNNALYRLIISKYKNISDFCSANSLTYNTVSRYLSFKMSPISKYAKSYSARNVYEPLSGLFVLPSAIKIATALGVSFYEAFPEISHEAKKNKFELEIDSSEMISFNDNALLKLPPPMGDYYDFDNIKTVLKRLPPREGDIIQKRFGIDCEAELLDTLADKYGVSRERIRQLEARAMRMLRHPSFKSQLIKSKKA